MLPQELLDQGWIQLFDGETLFGWQPTGEAKWEVVDGEIRTAGDEAGLLDDDDRVGRLRAARRVSTPARTRTAASFCARRCKPTNPASDCYELNIAPPDNPFPTGSFVGRQKASTVATTNFRQPTSGTRSTSYARRGDSITVVLDGERVLEYTDPIARAHWPHRSAIARRARWRFATFACGRWG